MKKLLQKIAENKFSLHLAESSMEYINSFKVVKSFKPGQDLDILEHWELEYELEYKYSMMQSKTFSGLERRKNNIIRILEDKSKEIIPPLAKTLYKTFKKWLASHALTDPKKWAEARYYNEERDTMVDIFGIDDSFTIILEELKRYGSSINNMSDLIFTAVQRNPDILNKDFLNEVVLDEAMIAQDILENEDIEDFNIQYNQDFEDEDEAESWIELTFAAFDNDYIRYKGGEKEALQDILFQLEETEFFNYGDVHRALNIDKLFLTAYEYIVFPRWFDYWEAMGIVETRKTVEKVTMDLSKIKSMPLRKQFMVLNIAKNVNHQNGSMMEYYEEDWGVDYVAMKRLTDMDTRNWDRELEEIGVDI